MSSVDVIVPCYRYGHFLKECVESVLAQSVQNVRVLIIDDASPDNTAEVAADLVKKIESKLLAEYREQRAHCNIQRRNRMGVRGLYDGSISGRLFAAGRVQTLRLSWIAPRSWFYFARP
jgi:glycosyltransferase involved in cell wall biosynthesis